MEARAQSRANTPARNPQSTAPTTVIDSPQISSFRNRSRAATGATTAATHNAPSVDRGDTSTSADPMLIESATASGSPPPTWLTRLGTIGRNAGRTTPSVLLY